MERYRSFRVKFIPATDKKSPRISIHDLWYRKKKSIKFSLFDSGDCLDRGIAYLESIEIKISGISQSEGSNRSFYDAALTNDFETPLS